MKRAARVGDGFIFGTNPRRVRGDFERVRELLSEQGRDPADFGYDASIDFSAGEEHWRSHLELWQELGGTHLSLRAMDTAAELVGERRVGYSGPKAYIDALETVMKAVS